MGFLLLGLRRSQALTARQESTCNEQTPVKGGHR